jgi:hypothetical protein
MALIEQPVLFGPALTTAAGAKQSRVIIIDNNGLVHPPFR